MKLASSLNFNELINKEVVLVDFSATWCGPCKMLSPVIEELSCERRDIKFVKVDVDECRDIAKNYGIMSVPTLILFKNGKEIKKNIGFISKEDLNNWINESTIF